MFWKLVAIEMTIIRILMMIMIMMIINIIMIIMTTRILLITEPNYSVPRRSVDPYHTQPAAALRRP